MRQTRRWRPVHVTGLRTRAHARAVEEFFAWLLATLLDHTDRLPLEDRARLIAAVMDGIQLRMRGRARPKKPLDTARRVCYETSHGTPYTVMRTLKFTSGIVSGSLREDGHGPLCAGANARSRPCPPHHG